MAATRRVRTYAAKSTTEELVRFGQNFLLAMDIRKANREGALSRHRHEKAPPSWWSLVAFI